MKSRAAGVNFAATAIFIPSLLFMLILPSASQQTSQSQAPSIQVTVAPPSGDFPTPFGEVQPTALPMPTVGSGQTFDQDAANRPETATSTGDDLFGFGRIQGRTNLLLVWFTDEAGTHYLVVDETN